MKSRLKKAVEKATAPQRDPAEAPRPCHCGGAPELRDEGTAQIAQPFYQCNRCPRRSPARGLTSGGPTPAQAWNDYLANNPTSKSYAVTIQPGVRLIGWDAILHKHSAAIVERPLARPALAGVYARLAPNARQQMLTAKRWKVWGVLATDSWTDAHRGHAVAP